MMLKDRIAEYVSAGFSGLWVQSHEHEDAITEIAQLCGERGWRIATWDIDGGLSARGQGAGTSVSSDGAADPLAALRSLRAMAAPDISALLVLRNFHRFLGSAEIVGALDRQIAEGKRNGTFIIILAPVVQIPVELEKVFVVIDHDLPGREQLEEIARSLATEPGDLPEGGELATLLDSSAGLTRLQAEGAYGLSLVRHGRIAPQAVWEIKAGDLQKSGLMSLHRGGETFSDLGGLQSLKGFCTRALRRTSSRHPEARPRGVLLLGVSGSGKSAFCKALGNETGRPTLVLDVGALMGSLVGQTEQNVRQALRIADAMAPCILFCDEIEKALSGVGSSGQTDSGVTSRLFGSLLTWLNDHQTDVFFVASANNISKLPPELTRCERFDGIFFIDLPSTQEKAIIWRMYIEKFGLDPEQPKPRDKSWTGAEIKSCCRLAALLDVPLVEAARNIVPVAVTAGESVERLRQWARGRCLSATEPGIFGQNSTDCGNGRRRVRRDISAN